MLFVNINSKKEKNITKVYILLLKNGTAIIYNKLAKESNLVDPAYSDCVLGAETL